MSQINTNAILDASGGTTTSINGYTPSASNMAGRNRIINGAMTIHQRGGAITSGYTLDRFGILNTTDGAISVTQDTNAPSNFKNSLKVTVTTADSSLASTQRLAIRHRLEGNNVADFDFGSSSAQTVTLSFWVRSSETGTYGGSLQNSATNRTYVFSYSISAADTWEKKTITVAGDTSGTWATDNSEGICINWSLGCGSSFLNSAGSWLAADAKSVTGESPLIGTLNATWYITGVQLEVGSTASEFEHRQYGQELALCQRYYEPFGTFDCSGAYISAAAVSVYSHYCYKIEKRASPTVSTTLCQTQASGGGVTARTLVFASNNTRGFSPQLAGSDPRASLAGASSAEL